MKDVVMEIAGVGVKERELLLHGNDNARMRMADERDVVVNVEIGTAGFVVKALAPATHDFERVIVRDAEIWAEQFFALGERSMGRNFTRRETALRNPENEIWIGRNAGEHVTLRSEGYSRKIGGLIEEIQNDLEMEVGSPATIFGSCADAGK